MEDAHGPHRILPRHESGIRRLCSEAYGTSYHPLRSFTEARADDDGVVILEADFGHQILAVGRVSCVGSTPQALLQLAKDLSGIYWPDAHLDGAAVFYERLPIGAFVDGGEGGGWVMDDIWVHPWLIADELEDDVGRVMRGDLQRLPAAQGPAIDFDREN